ncbi:protein kinase [Achromobacter mucicolens]|uniref:serine/threonine protein kinase n=1 Tax=Achromobacter mucicolens TaxID=1389922 RepID=UPI0020A26BEE|nr:protein kinase [Achromobacter mucicolens]MCP2514436.1 protein kinase [Achromobacter mucicolens]
MSKLYIEGSNAPPEIKTSLLALSKNIEFQREDSKASNGHVFFGINRVTSTPVTVKYYYWGGKAEYHAEPRQLAQIYAQNVLKILDAGLIDTKWAYFMTPTCTGGDLDLVLESSPLGVKTALDYAYQTLSGLSHLHGNRFLHRDIKLANLYLTEGGWVVIGDFGSVKRLPEAASTIPASSHSLAYRPPETIITNTYGVPGDIYQCGLVLYQLLGGTLAYDGLSWLSKREVTQLETLATQSHKEEFVDRRIKAKIAAGKATDLTSLPPWVPKSIRRMINKACHVDAGQRFQTASAFMAKIHELRPSVPDWQVIEGYPTLMAKTSYRIVGSDDGYIVQKRAAGDWRNDNTITGRTLEELVDSIAQKA